MKTFIGRINWENQTIISTSGGPSQLRRRGGPGIVVVVLVIGLLTVILPSNSFHYYSIPRITRSVFLSNRGNNNPHGSSSLMKLVLSRSVFSTGMTMTRWMTYLTTVSRPMSPRVMSTFNPSLPGLGIVSAPLYFSSTSYNGNNNNKRHHIGDRGNRDHSRPETISLYGTASDYHSDRLSMLLLGRSFPIPIGGSSCFSSTALQARRWRSSASSDKSEEWEVPDTIPIPEEKLDFHYVRSSGPGDRM